MDVFDASAAVAHRERAAHEAGDDPDDWLEREVALRLLDRVEDCKRTFARAAVIGGPHRTTIEALARSRAEVQTIVVVDPSTAALERTQRWLDARRADPGSRPLPAVTLVGGPRASPDTPDWRPLPDGSVDIVVSALGLQWVNKLPEAMAGCRRALVPDGLFLAVMAGGNTLQELRIALSTVDLERRGGVSARVSPTARIRDGGNLLGRAGLVLSTCDLDEIRIGYPDAFALVSHLRRLGASNAAPAHPGHLSVSEMAAAAATYRELFPGSRPESIEATLQLMYMTGWSPAPHTPQAARRGSGTVSFEDIERIAAEIEDKDKPKPE
ncbi:unnamed protein product [Pedinophyceae sp. YPF-701]|nr:unnamed protein product [Pedinophyceae sp. YPF-701]